MFYVISIHLFIYFCTSFANFVRTKQFLYTDQSIFMPVSFKMVAKKNNLMSPPQIKYFPCAVAKGEIDLDNLSDMVASQSTISKADCYGVIMALTKVIGDSLSEGKIVRIDGLGAFQITLQGSPADTPDELGKSNIKGARIIYKPSAKMKRKLTELAFKRIR